MYGYQGNNSQPYSYQNSSGSSYGNIGQYPGPYHSHYSNGTTAYNSFPSNDQSCSSLGVLPQEYSQVGNAIHRPYYFDSNSSYHRPYPPLPYNQSLDLPVTNSYSTCPRNCHCCESINPKYFPASNSLQHQANNQTLCDSPHNASYSGFRKGLNTSRWRESNTQQPNIIETTDSSNSWSIPKYGTSYKGEPCVWPLSQKQPSNFENSEHIAPGNGYLLPQQHQRKPVTNNQTYSALHSNSILSVQAPRLPPGRSDDIMGNCFTGYPCGSDFKKGAADHAPYNKQHLNKIPPPNRPICNLSSNCEGGFSYKFSSFNTNVYHENQKCAIESSKLVSQLPSTLVESFQRRIPSSNVLEVSNEMPYCQPGLMPSVHQVDPPTRRTYSIPTEGDPRILLTCSSSASSDVLQASRLQLPPMHSLKPTGIVMSGPPKDLCDEISYNPSQNPCRDTHDSTNRISAAHNAPISNSSIRNSNQLTEKVCDRYLENPWRNHPEIVAGSCDSPGGVPSSRHSEKQFYSEPSSDYVEPDHKLKICKETPVKQLQSVGGNAVIGDLRHFLSTWDDGDDEESYSVMPSALSGTPNGTQEQFVVEKDTLEECTSVSNLSNQEQLALDKDTQEKCTSVSNLPMEVDNHGNSTKYGDGGDKDKGLSSTNTPIGCTSSYKVYNCDSEINSLHMHSSCVLGVGEAIMNTSSISTKSCSELEQHLEHIRVKSTDVSRSNSEQAQEEICSPLQINPNPDLRIISHDISHINENSGSSHIEALNDFGKGIRDGEETSAHPIRVGNEVDSKSLDSSQSQVFSSEFGNGSPAGKSEEETLTHNSNGAVRMEESSGIVDPENTISGKEETESVDEVCRGKDEPKPGAVLSLVNSISSSALLEDPNLPADKGSSRKDPEKYLSLKQPKSSSEVFTPSHVKAQECLVEVESGTLDSNSKGMSAKDMENGTVMNGKRVSDPGNEVNDKSHDDICPDGQELKSKTDPLKNTSISHDDNLHHSSPKEMNDALTGRSVSDSPLEKIVNKVLEGCQPSEGQVFEMPNVGDEVFNDVVNRKAHTSSQHKSINNALNGFEGSQKHCESGTPNFLPVTQNHLSEEDVLMVDNKASCVKELGGIFAEFSTAKSTLESRKKRSSTVFPRKSSYHAALLIRKKYQSIILNNLKRRLAERQNEKSKFLSLVVRKVKNGHCFVKKSKAINCKNHCRNVVIPELEEIITEQSIPPGNIHNSEKVTNLKNDVDECRKSLKDVDSTETKDDEVPVTHPVCLEQIIFSTDRDESAFPVSECVIESSGESDIRAKPFNQDRECKSLNHESCCIAEGTKVLVTTEGEKISFEEVEEEEDALNTIHGETSSREESSNLQYWCNYELGNDLGVAMEIEVGSDVPTSNSVEYKHSVDNGVFPPNGMNEKGPITVEGEVTCHQGRCTTDKSDKREGKGHRELRTTLQSCHSVGIEDCLEMSISSESCESIKNNEENVPESITSHLGDNSPKNIPNPMVESNNSEDIVTSSQPKKQFIHPYKSKSKSSSSKPEDPAGNKKLGNSEERTSDSFCCTLMKCSIELHSELSNTEEASIVDSKSSCQDQREGGKESTSLSTLDSQLIHSPEEINLQNKCIVCEDGCSGQEFSMGKNDQDISVLIPEIGNERGQRNLLAMGNQHQSKLESVCVEKCGSLDCKQESGLQNQSVHDLTRRAIGKKNFMLKHTVEDSMTENLAIVQQKEFVGVGKILKTKASLKYFDNAHKNGRKSKYGFWKNRFSFHRRKFGHKFKNVILVQNRRECIMARKFNQKSPLVLQMSFTPPPKALSPLHVLEDSVNDITEKSYHSASQTKCNFEPSKRHDEDNTNVPLSDSEISTLHEKNFMKGDPKSSSTLHPTEDVRQKKVEHKVTDSASEKEKDLASDLHFSEVAVSGDSTPLILEETKATSSFSTMNSSLIEMSSESIESPHVRMSFKKVLNGSKKNMWMKRPLHDNLLKSQDCVPSEDSKVVKRKGSSDCDSPLPKVTIKKKRGEKGYQSFLSGFSSASSSPSTSPTFLSKTSSPLHLNTSPEQFPSGKCNAYLNENPTGVLSCKDFNASIDCLQSKKCTDNSSCEMSAKNSNDEHKFYTNIVEKKEGTGLVFVIRTVGGNTKNCSGKDKCEHPNGIKEGCHTGPNSSSNATNAVDDDWEIGPWSAWQPVVKLSRSCELDLLALKMHSPSDVVEGKQTHEKVSNSIQGNGVSVIELKSSSTQGHKRDSEELNKKSKFPRERKFSKNEYGEIIMGKDGPLINYGTNKVEFDKIMRECDRLHLPKKKPKPGNKSHLVKGLKIAKSANFLNSLNIDVKKKEHLDRKEVDVVKLRPNISSEATSVVDHSGRLKKNELDSEIPSNIPVRGTSSVDLTKRVKEEKLGGSNSSDNKVSAAIRKLENDGISDVESAGKFRSPDIFSPLQAKKELLPISAYDTELDKIPKSKEIIDIGLPEEVLCTVQVSDKEPSHNSSENSMVEKEATTSDQFLYSCEACCRKFSSQKWLSRHCRGVSHSRVENAQRQAVQALLLLLTGSESHLLKPLSEKEFSHLKSWPSHAVPSPLQLALNEILDAT
ncbi:uncharacterized protein LOC124162569 [Ischnura elegans]|uniref:uncharacterized protein LOC124162569 n=1 Tax=Ischnura elegans TaxID=197161 RepID=UPI001ED891B1|nr:uncharacterized protein LOC124162569 [Ischnura elegans]